MQIYSPINDITEEEIDRFCRAKGQCNEGGDFLFSFFFTCKGERKKLDSMDSITKIKGVQDG